MGIAACHAKEKPTLPKSLWFPYVIYSVPEIFICGISKEDLQKRGIAYELGVTKRYKWHKIGVCFTSMLCQCTACFGLRDDQNIIIAHLNTFALAHPTYPRFYRAGRTVDGRCANFI